MPQPSARPLIPFLRYSDAPSAIDWLADAFGLEIRDVYPADDGGIAHAQLSAGPRAMIMLSTLTQGPLGLTTPVLSGSPTQGIYVIVGDVDAHHERAVARGAEVVVPLRDTEYGSREYTVRDPEGHLWSFGSYDPFGDD